MNARHVVVSTIRKRIDEKNKEGVLHQTKKKGTGVFILFYYYYYYFFFFQKSKELTNKK